MSTPAMSTPTVTKQSRRLRAALGEPGVTRLTQAVADAERSTSAEIAVFVREWSFWPSRFGVRASPAKLRARAEKLFVAHGLDQTRERNAIMIYVSLKERVAVVLGDVGIDRKITPETWREVSDGIAAQARAGKLVEGIAQAITRAAEILAQHFPRAADDRNELADAPNLEG